MANIVQIYTAEQLYNLYQNKIINDGVGLTDFNAGSATKSIIEANSEIISSIAFDFKEAIYKAIPQALYVGFGFEKKSATYAIGYLRPYRKPVFYITYTGAGTSATITSSSTNMISAVTGAPTDAFSLAYSTYETVEELVDAIDVLTNWSATLVGSGSVQTDTLYQYTNKEVITATNYLNATGLDIMTEDAIAVSVPSGFLATVDDSSFYTTVAGTILAGESSATILAQCSLQGTSGNISASAIDTLNGKGFIAGSIDGVEQVINDSAFSGGAAEETEQARAIRFKDTVNSLNAGTKNGITVAIKGIDGVRDCGMRTAFPFKGTNTIIVDDGTGTISASLQAEVEKVLYGDPDDFANYPGKNAEGIGYNIVAPVISAVSVGITITRLSNVAVDLDDIKTDVQTAIEQYINTRSLGQNVLLSEIIRVAKNSNAAVYDAIITSPSSNVAISDGEFAKTGSGTGASVTVTASIASSV